jgi:hypothetical protein
VSANGASFASLDAFAQRGGVDDSGIAEFRKFAEAQGVSIPVTADSDATLKRVLSAAIARSKFGDAGFYRVASRLDPEVQVASKALDDSRFAFLSRAP